MQMATSHHTATVKTSYSMANIPKLKETALNQKHPGQTLKVYSFHHSTLPTSYHTAMWIFYKEILSNFDWDTFRCSMQSQMCTHWNSTMPEFIFWLVCFEVHRIVWWWVYITPMRSMVASPYWNLGWCKDKKRPKKNKPSGSSWQCFGWCDVGRTNKDKWRGKFMWAGLVAH